MLTFLRPAVPATSRFVAMKVFGRGAFPGSAIGTTGSMSTSSPHRSLMKHFATLSSRSRSQPQITSSGYSETTILKTTSLPMISSKWLQRCTLWSSVHARGESQNSSLISSVMQVRAMSVRSRNSVRKRFRMNANGLLKYKSSGNQHMMRKYNRKRNRRLNAGSTLKPGHPDYNRIKRMM